jgi:3-oxoacyl-[acyl-carrier protein] reductase
MDLGLKDRVALVIGGTRGLGRAIAHSLARERTRVVIAARTETQLRDTAEEFRRSTGAQVIGIPTDVTRRESVRQLVDQTLARWGRIDIAIANTPGPPLGGFDAVTLEHFERAVHTTLLSTIHLAKEVTPHMRQRRWGRFIAIASVAAKQQIPDLILANTIRPGLLGFVKSMATELAPYGVLCNVVAPGFIATRRVEEMAAQKADREGITLGEVLEEINSHVPLGRLGSAEEVADMVTFLASERASYITGTAIQVDGGFVQSVQ